MRILCRTLKKLSLRVCFLFDTGVEEDEDICTERRLNALLYTADTSKNNPYLWTGIDK